MHLKKKRNKNTQTPSMPGMCVHTAQAHTYTRITYRNNGTELKMVGARKCAARDSSALRRPAPTHRTQISRRLDAIRAAIANVSNRPTIKCHRRS